MTDQLPALQVVVPLLAAPVCLLIRHAGTVRIFAILTSWIVLGISLLLLDNVEANGTISYAMGQWAPPLGIEYRIDILNVYVLVVVASVSAVILPFGMGSAEERVPKERYYLYYAAFLLCIAGLMGISITGDAFNLFVFIEITSLAIYSLVSLGPQRRALIAGFSYLIMGTIGGTFILIGIGMMYQMTGTLNMADLAQRLPAVIETRTIWMAFAFLVVGTSIKLAVFPLHQWLPNAYTYAPSAVSAFLAATVTKVFYYVLVRIIFTIFGAAFVFDKIQLQYILLPLSILAMFVGSIAAVFQHNIKRLLAYSSIAQIGYMTLGLSYANVEGLTGGLVHIFNHAMMKGGLFLVVACVTYRIGSSELKNMQGLGRHMPLTMAAFVIGGISLAGVPGTVGFISKWYLVLGAMKNEWYIVAVLILMSSFIAFVYIWRVVEIVYFQEREDTTPVQEAPLRHLIPTWILIGGSIYFGFASELTAGVAGR
ncbi:MAG: monovalent cation/H+ antiporter subunit D family protein, partial [Candidatus Latescibacteria bacterium]|nr:monovalent cation/H+ antiporter subunit D family protein [Candidatus Latescibacterota bacterium]